MGRYDVIVVGGRAAGAPTAMLLARQGHRVLLVDRGRFGSDTISTHLVHPTGVAALQRWGLAEALAASGCPSIDTYRFDFDGIVLSGTPAPSGQARVAYGPRRTVLDAMLVEAAADSGVEVRHSCGVESLLFDGDRVVGVRTRSHGSMQDERATVVVGADGRRSVVAAQVGAGTYRERPIQTAGYYAYWSGVPVDDFRVYVRPQRAVVMLPTHDDLRLVLVGWPREQFATHRQDLDGAYRRGVEAVPQVAELLGDARRQTRITGTGDLLNCFRHPYGLGWALVGDAGYVRDPCTAQGISDSFRDAELLADALDAYLRGDEVYDTALAGYHRRRDAAVRAMYDFTYRLAQMKPLPAPVRGIFRTLQYDQRAMDLFVSGVAGTAPVNAATGPRSLGRALLARARARGYGRTAPTGPDGPDGPDDAARGGPVGGDLPSLRDLA